MIILYMIKKAISYLTSRDVKPGDVVMFDIDDTLISSKTGKPLTDVVNLLYMSKILGYKVIIITARHPLSRQYTELQLGSVGVFPDAVEFCSAWDKTALKQALSIIHNYTFILSVGDLPTDLGGSIYSLLIN